MQRRNWAATLLVIAGVLIAGCQEEEPTGPGRQNVTPTPLVANALPGLVSLWPGEGNANDVQDGNHGTLQGGVTFAAGQVGQAFLLDGIDDFVGFGNAPNLRVSGGDFSVVTWVLFNALSGGSGPGGDMSIIDKMSASGVNADGWRLLKQTDNRFWFCFGAGGNACGSGSHTVFSVTRAVTGTWYHVAAVKSSSTFSIYVNGVREDTRSLPTFVDTHAADLRIGSYVLEGAHLKGKVDEAEIYNRALSQPEILAIFNAGSDGDGGVDVSTARIAFSSTRDGNQEVYVMNADGSGQTRLTHHAAPDGTPNWFPDGTKLAFVSQRDGNDEIYLMSANGSGRTNLSNNPAFDGYPYWSPDGTRLAFVSNRSGGDIYVMNADGTGVTNLTNSGGVDDPAWSPDGTRLTFRSFRHGAPEIYVMKADGSDQTRLTNHPATDTDADWSPDGTKIAFSSTRDGNSEIYLMNPDGSDLTRLTTDLAVDRDPSWSPDGTRLAWMAERDGNREIYVMNADGTGPVNITNNPADDLEPDWRPVVTPPCTPSAITQQPQGASKLVGQEMTFSVTATGTNPQYQWQKNGTDIPGATGSSYTIASVGRSDAGQYTVRVTADCGAAVLSAAATLTVAQATQTITFNPNPLPNRTFGDPPFTVIASASPSNLPVSFEAAGNCTVSALPAAQVTLTGAGNCTVTATQTGDAQYAAADAVERPFQIGKGSATLAFDAASLTQTYTGQPRAATVTTDPTGLGVVAVTYDGSPTAPTDAGNYAVKATLDNANYAALEVTGTLVVQKAGATIVLGNLMHTFDGSPKAASAGTTPAGLTGVTLSYSRNGAAVASPTNAGSYQVLAKLSNPNYQASDASGTLAIQPATPTINWANPAAITVGTPLSGTQLNATAAGVGGVGLSGTFIYTPGAGTVLGPSPAQQLSVAFTLSDPNYTGASKTVQIAVRYSFSGFFQPVDNTPVVNKTNSGQAIPVKFTLGGNQGIDIFQPGSPTSGSYACTASPEDVVEQTETASTSGLTYDAASGQYKYVWKTEKAWANTCRRLVLKFKDGTSHEALFHFTR